jgi:hypothetical protein
LALYTFSDRDKANALPEEDENNNTLVFDTRESQQPPQSPLTPLTALPETTRLSNTVPQIVVDDPSNFLRRAMPFYPATPVGSGEISGSRSDLILRSKLISQHSPQGMNLLHQAVHQRRKEATLALLPVYQQEVREMHFRCQRTCCD